MNLVIAFCISAIVLLFTRILWILKFSPSIKRLSAKTCHVAIFLGSGGHTSEMLQLLKGLDFERYEPRSYIISEGDQLSASKAAELEDSSDYLSDYTITTIPRARKVLQPLWTVPITAFISLYACIKEISIKPIVTRTPFADLLLLNGPGTCVPLVIAVFINRILGLQSPRVIYVESFTRVKDLSLSGRILQPLVDSFIVQWPKLVQGGKRGQYAGWLV